MKNMYALKNKPSGYYLMDGPVVLDQSGYGRNGVLTGTAEYGVSLSRNSSKSMKMGTSNYATVSVPNTYNVGRESGDFSMSAIVYPVYIESSTTGSMQIVSHVGSYDGLSISGTTINFSTHYAVSGVAKCSYDMKMARKAHIVGVHSAEKNSLYVDGILVDEVDISQAQRADKYIASANTSFIVGYCGTTNRVLVNNVGIYSRPLKSEDILSLYLWDSKVSEGSVAKMYGGEDIPVGINARPPYINTGWYTDEDWNAAELSGTIADGDSLYCEKMNNLTIGGTWNDSVDLYDGNTATLINSMDMWWEGKGETVEASIDGTTWAVVTRGENISVIPEGFNPTDKALYVRITFAAGLEEAFVSNMSIRGYIGSVVTTNGRQATYYNPAIGFSEKSTQLMRDDTNLRTPGLGKVAIAGSTSEELAEIRTIEVWAKPDAEIQTGFAVAGTIKRYQNAGTSSGLLKKGEWVLYHSTFSTPVTVQIVLNIPGTLGSVAFYPTALSAQEVADIYANYTGIKTDRIVDGSSMSLSEPAASTKVYAHDWEVQTA